ncbi:MAG: glycoside hydrolase, partial [Clostridia bacterium]|nr:glycoside hydrolase [Clostridia bacterium]
MTIKNPVFTERDNDTGRREPRHCDFLIPSFLKDAEVKGLTASFIWEKECAPHTVVCFVKDFEVFSLPEKAEAVISADSKYMLWVNGRRIVIEGGLKRGFAPGGSYCERVDLAPWLREGKNRVAAAVRYFGQDGFSHVSSGRGGFLFDCAALGIMSGRDFKARRDEAYIPDLDDEYLPNYRLSEGNLYYDARLSTGEFYKNDYDVSDWQGAAVICAAGEAPFGPLYDRIIPQFRDFGVKYFENGRAGRNLFTDRVLVFDLPYNCQFSPVLELDAPAGKRLDMYTDTYSDRNGLCLRAVYITEKGRQAFEPFMWTSGEKLYLHVPRGVDVVNVGYRETGYDADFEGRFSSGDGVLDAVFKKSARTLYLTMRDTFMDCPDRERAQWWGDAVNESEMCYYALDRRAELLIKKGILSMAAWQHKDGAMQTFVPDMIGLAELPLQNLAGITGFYNYYLFTGDASILPAVYRLSVSYLSLWKKGDDGLVVHHKGTWDWPDWGVAADYPVLENAWYYYALRSAAEIGRAAGLGGSEILESRAASLKEAFDKAYWDGSAYASGALYDDRANAVAVVSGLASKDKYPAVIEIFKSVYNSSPYMEKYVLEALCRMDRPDLAAARIRKRYGEMARDRGTTLWEVWSEDEGT